MNIDIKLLHPDARIPSYGSAGAAGADLYACIEKSREVHPGETEFIPTGIALAIPERHVGLIFARSGMASKRGVAPANKVGVIDSDYRGEVTVALHNHGAESVVIEPGERIAQLAIMPVEQAFFQQTDDLDDTKRGAGGFGSTGYK